MRHLARRFRSLTGPFVFACTVAGTLTATRVGAAPFEETTPATIGATGEWSNKVRLADIDHDGDVDILFANGAGYAAPGGPEPNRVFLNQTVEAGPGAPFVEAGAMDDPARVIVARDLSGDGVIDLFVGPPGARRADCSWARAAALSRR